MSENKSVESTANRKIIKYTYRVGAKNKPTSVFSKNSGPESSKQYTEVTSTETKTINTFKKTNISRFEPPNYSDHLVSMYSSNQGINILTQLKHSCK